MPQRLLNTLYLKQQTNLIRTFPHLFQSYFSSTETLKRNIETETSIRNTKRNESL